MLLSGHFLVHETVLEVHNIPEQYDALYPVKIIHYRDRAELVPVKKHCGFFKRAIRVESDYLVFHNVLKQRFAVGLQKLLNVYYAEQFFVSFTTWCIITASCPWLSCGTPLRLSYRLLGRKLNQAGSSEVDDLLLLFAEDGLYFWAFSRVH